MNPPSDDIDTLRTYAAMLDMPRREYPGGPVHQPTECNRAAAAALRFKANALELIRKTSTQPGGTHDRPEDPR